MTTLLIIVASVSLVGLAACLAVAIRSHRRKVKAQNSEFHRALLQETEERLLRFRPATQGCSS